jgi:tyrosinase
MSGPVKSPSGPYVVEVHGSNNTINFYGESKPSSSAGYTTAPTTWVPVEIHELTNPGMRKSIQTLIEEHSQGQPQGLDDLVRAFYLIQLKDPSDPHSFFAIGAMHGQPFKLRPQVDSLTDQDRYVYWGGFCHHGNVLFPLWHRAYLQHLENALQSVVPSAHMAYWDQLDGNPLPQIFMDENYKFDDGTVIKNPLRFYVLQQDIQDMPGQNDYDKYEGYETVRYPYSGLVGTPEARANTAKHNAQFTVEEGNANLVKNISIWQNGPQPRPDKWNPNLGSTYKLEQCLKAPNYTIFSNTTSVDAYNLSLAINHPEDIVYSIENPHNDIHLAIGGFDMGDIHWSPIPGANGDMGENNTAGFDPIFFFHHAFIDYMLWEWQNLHNSTKSIAITRGYPGTSTFDSQGPTPGYGPNDSLDEKSNLYPYIRSDSTSWTANDIADYEALGFTYEQRQTTKLRRAARNTEHASYHAEEYRPDWVVVQSVNRKAVKGSAVLVAWAGTSTERKKYLIGYRSILSRWDVNSCANCRTHMEMTSVFHPRCIPVTENEELEYFAELITHDGVDREQVPAVNIY